MRRRASPGYRDLDFCDRDLGNWAGNFPYEHFSPITGMKLERSRLVHLRNRAENSHMNSDRAEILPQQEG